MSRPGRRDDCALAFTPDGKHLASIGDDGIARIEEVGTGTELIQERFFVSYPRLAFSADGTSLAVGGSSRGTAWVWDWQAGNPPRAIKVQPRGAGSVSFSRDGKVLATSEDAGLGVHLWDVASGRLLRTIGAEGDSAVARSCFSPDGRYVATVYHQHQEVFLLDPTTGKVLRRLRAQASRVGDLAWSSDSGRLAALDAGGVHIWEAATGKAITVPEGHTRTPSHVELLAGGIAMTSADDGTARLWDARTGKRLRTVRASDDWLRGSALSPDGRWLVTSTLGTDHAVCLWDAKTGRRVYRQAGHGRLGGVRVASFSADGKRFLSWGDDMYLRTWEVRNGKATAEHAIRPDGEDVPDLDDPAEQRRRMGMSWTGAFSRAGDRLVLAGWKGFFVFDTATGKQLVKFKHEVGFIEGMAISPDGKLLLTNALGRSRLIKMTDGRMRSTAGKPMIALHELATGKLVRELPEALRMPGPVAFSRDGKLLALASSDDHARISFFDTATGAARAAIDRIPGRIWALGLSPDGTHVIAGMDDSTALVWKIPDKKDSK
jgi:WD40 repeat protein